MILPSNVPPSESVPVTGTTTLVGTCAPALPGNAIIAANMAANASHKAPIRREGPKALSMLPPPLSRHVHTSSRLPPSADRGRFHVARFDPQKARRVYSQ